MCEFPECDNETVGMSRRCELHERVMVNASYLNDREATEE